MQKQLLLGVEAIAQGAIDSGISGVYAYPGTPSTEITEYIQNSKEAIARNVHRAWAANEKTAMESAYTYWASCNTYNIHSAKPPFVILFLYLQQM